MWVWYVVVLLIIFCEIFFDMVEIFDCWCGVENDFVILECFGLFCIECDLIVFVICIIDWVCVDFVEYYDV